MKTVSPTPFRGQKIAIVGEFPDAGDLQGGVPFSSKAGQELTRMLRDAGIERRDCWFSYAIPFTPKVGFQDVSDIKDVCVSKSEHGTQCSDAGVLPRSPLAMGKYLPPSYFEHVDALVRDLQSLRPNIIIALGPLALWALTSSGNLPSVRGTVVDSPYGKVLPTYSPNRVLAQWSARVVAIVDLIKAKRESASPEFVRPNREIWIDPSLEDMDEFFRRYIEPSDQISVDIETKGGMITCIGFAPDPEHALVVPFVDTRQPDLSYWRTAREEVKAWKFVRSLLQSKLTKITQNGLYDYQWLWKEGKIGRISGPFEDTMIFHHTMQPELEKGLGFLGSVYTNEASWKLMRKRSGDETEKANE